MSPKSEPTNNSASSATTTAPAPKRRRISKACLQCRTRKIKCNGKEPACANCIETNQECTYTESRRRGLPPGYVMHLETYIKSFELIMGVIVESFPDAQNILDQAFNHVKSNDPATKITQSRCDHYQSLWKSTPYHEKFTSLASEIAEVLSNSNPSSSKSQIDVSSLQNKRRPEASTDGSKSTSSTQQGVTKTSAQNTLPFNSKEHQGDVSLCALNQYFGPSSVFGPYHETLSYIIYHRMGKPVKTYQWIRSIPSVQKMELIEYYFFFVHSWLPIVNRKEILQLVQRSEGDLESIEREKLVLLASVFTISLQMIRHQSDSTANPFPNNYNTNTDFFSSSTPIKTDNNISGKNDATLNSNNSDTTPPNSRENQSSSSFPKKNYPSYSVQYLEILAEVVSPFGQSENITKSHIFVIQAYIIYSLVLIASGLLADAWTMIGLATRHAYTCGFHSFSSSTSTDWTKRVWYACCIVDTLIASVVGRIPHVSASDFNVEPLDTSTAWEEWEVKQAQQPIKMESLINTQFHIYGPHDAQWLSRPGKVITIYNSLFNLIELLNSFLHSYNDPSQNNLSASSDSSANASSLSNLHSIFGQAENADYSFNPSSDSRIQSITRKNLGTRMHMWSRKNMAILTQHSGDDGTSDDGNSLGFSDNCMAPHVANIHLTYAAITGLMARTDIINSIDNYSSSFLFGQPPATNLVPILSSPQLIPVHAYRLLNKYSEWYGVNASTPFYGYFSCVSLEMAWEQLKTAVSSIPNTITNFESFINFGSLNVDVSALLDGNLGEDATNRNSRNNPLNIPYVQNELTTVARLLKTTQEYYQAWNDGFVTETSFVLKKKQKFIRLYKRVLIHFHNTLNNSINQANIDQLSATLNTNLTKNDENQKTNDNNLPINVNNFNHTFNNNNNHDNNFNNSNSVNHGTNNMLQYISMLNTIAKNSHVSRPKPVNTSSPYNPYDGNAFATNFDMNNINDNATSNNSMRSNNNNNNFNKSSDQSNFNEGNNSSFDSPFTPAFSGDASRALSLMLQRLEEESQPNNNNNNPNAMFNMKQRHNSLSKPFNNQSNQKLPQNNFNSLYNSHNNGGNNSNSSRNNNNQDSNSSFLLNFQNMYNLPFLNKKISDFIANNNLNNNGNNNNTDNNNGSQFDFNTFSQLQQQLQASASTSDINELLTGNSSLGDTNLGKTGINNNDDTAHLAQESVLDEANEIPEFLQNLGVMADQL